MEEWFLFKNVKLRETTMAPTSLFVVRFAHYCIELGVKTHFHEPKGAFFTPQVCYSQISHGWKKTVGEKDDIGL